MSSTKDFLISEKGYKVGESKDLVINNSGNVRQQIPIALGTISGTTSACVLVAPCAGSVESCKVVNASNIAKASDSWTVTLVNKGTTGTAAVTMATANTGTASGTAMAAYVPWKLAVDKANNTLTEGETVIVTFTEAGTATATAETLLQIDFKPVL